MLVKNKKNFLYFSSRLIGISSITFVLILIVFFPDSNNPDWNAYKLLYSKAEYYLTFSRTNFLFLSLASFFNDFISYKTFRIIIVFIQLFLYYLIFRNSKYKVSNLNIFICFPFIAFLILKVHIQIREGISLLLYFLTFLNISKNRVLSIKNFILTFLSLLMHSGSLLIWIPSAIFIIKKNIFKYKKIFIYIFFFLIAIFSINTHFRMFYNNQLSIVTNQYITLENYLNKFYSIEINIQKIIYWLCYLLIFISIYIEELKMNSIVLRSNSLQKVSYIFGAVSLNGLITFLPSIFVFSLFMNINSLDYNFIYRISSLLFFLLIFYRSTIHPKKFLTKILSIFISVDIFRMVFF